jgi:pyruvate,water dikinase
MTATPVLPAPVRFFDDLRRTDVAFAGGKGANLGELVSAGLPVPPGFVVGAPAYAAFCDESRLRERPSRRPPYGRRHSSQVRRCRRG